MNARRLAPFVFLAFLASACSSSTQFDRPVQQIDLDYLNDRVDGKEVTFWLENGTPIGAASFHAKSDSSEWGLGSNRKKVSTENIVRVDLSPISIPPRIASGFMIGAAAGALTGGYLVMTKNPAPTVHESVQTAAISLGVGMAAGAVLGFAKGMISRLFGSQDRYYLNWPKYKADSIVDANISARPK
jgi:hypothetical protein